MALPWSRAQPRITTHVNTPGIRCIGTAMAKYWRAVSDTEQACDCVRMFFPRCVDKICGNSWYLVWWLPIEAVYSIDRPPHILIIPVAARTSPLCSSIFVVSIRGREHWDRYLYRIPGCPGNSTSDEEGVVGDTFLEYREWEKSKCVIYRTPKYTRWIIG